MLRIFYLKYIELKGTYFFAIFQSTNGFRGIIIQDPRGNQFSDTFCDFLVETESLYGRDAMHTSKQIVIR